jgi:hypothetical protein
MVEIYSTYSKDEKCIYNFTSKFWMEDMNWEAYVWVECNINMDFTWTEREIFDLRMGEITDLCKHSNEHQRFIKSG